jgi:hypothetical protein
MQESESGTESEKVMTKIKGNDEKESVEDAFFCMQWTIKPHFVRSRFLSPRFNVLYIFFVSVRRSNPRVIWRQFLLAENNQSKTFFALGGFLPDVVTVYDVPRTVACLDIVKIL